MAEPSRDVPLSLLDLAIGTAVSGLGGLARGRDVMSRLAAPVTGPAGRAARTVTDRLPAVLDGPLQARGQAQRSAALAAVESWIGYVVPWLVGAVLDRLDLTELVIRRVDLDRVAQALDVDAVLDRLDLTELVIQRVDLDRVVRTVDIEAIVSGLDFNALVARIDVIGIAEQVIDGIDLPQLIRDSTGSVASEGIAGVRMQGMEADQAVAHFVDRVLRRRPRRPQPEQGPDGRGPASDDGAAVLDGQAR
jgi:hypothetical protein